MTRAEIEARQSLAALITEMRTLVDTAESANRDLSPEESATYDQRRAEVTTLRSRIERMAEVRSSSDDLDLPAEQRELPEVEGEVVERRDTRTIGERFIADGAVTAMRDRGYRGQASVALGPDVSIRALITGDPASPGGTMQNPDRLARVPSTLRDRALRLVDLIPHGQTNDNSVEYVQDTSPEDLTAAEVAEGAAKPEANITLGVVNDPVRTIAVWQKITRQAADDNSQLMSYLDGRLRYRVRRRLDSQIINGNGVGANLLGLLNRPGIQTLAPVAAEQRVVTIRKAKTLLETAEFEGAVTVLNPVDWEVFELTRATDGMFVTDPSLRDGSAPKAAWGTEVALSNTIASGTALVLDPTVAMLWDRQDPTAYMTDSDGNDFVSNILTLLLELRAALSLFEPKGIVRVTFNGNT
jgi:HK97 family phage major capsid protein